MVVILPFIDHQKKRRIMFIFAPNLYNTMCLLMILDKLFIHILDIWVFFYKIFCRDYIHIRQAKKFLESIQQPLVPFPNAPPMAEASFPTSYFLACPMWLYSLTTIWNT